MDKKKEKNFLIDADDAFDANESEKKVRITINLDGDILEAIKYKASVEGLKYQPWLNSFLRSALLGERTIESRVEGLSD